jgi:hypothetical protein
VRTFRLLVLRPLSFLQTTLQISSPCEVVNSSNLLFLTCDSLFGDVTYKKMTLSFYMFI